MPTVASYIESAKAALLAGDTEQAASICRHVLDHHPKHVEATCLLAEALRDQGELSQARDLFLRVVSADPTNIIAHWALGLIAEAENDLEWAAWELRRAYESNPGQAELRQELQRVTDGKPSLTTLGLAQTYAAGGLLDKAIEELRKLLAAEPARLDVAVALAETLWRAGQAEEAAQVSETILADSPDCLKANILLGAWLSQSAGEKRARGRQLLRRAQALDPAGTFAAELFAGQPLPEELRGGDVEIPPMPSEAGAAARPAGGAVVSRLALVESEGEVGELVAAESQRGRERAQSDLAGWLRDTSEQPATVQDALEARLASRAAQRQSADWRAVEDLDPEWQELLTDEITLDDEAEARLSEALSEMGFAQGEPAEEGWVEVPVTSASGHRHLSEVARSEAPAAPAHQPSGAGQPIGTSAGSARSGAPAGRAPAAPPEIGNVSPADAPTPDPAQPGGTGPEWARALLRAGDPEGALEQYRQILASSPDQAEEVVDGLKELIRAYPDLGAAHRVLGDAHMKSGRFQQAIEEYNWVLINRRKDA